MANQYRREDEKEYSLHLLANLEKLSCKLENLILLTQDFHKPDNSCELQYL